MGLAAAGCSKKSPSSVYNAELLASAAEQSMGPNETRARELLEELTLVIEGNIDDPARAEDLLRAFLYNYREELPANALALERELASRTDDERLRYEESFSNYLAPATKRWRDLMAQYTTRHESSGRRIQRLLHNAVSRGAIHEAGAARSVPEPVPTDMDNVRD